MNTLKLLDPDKVRETDSLGKTIWITVYAHALTTAHNINLDNSPLTSVNERAFAVRAADGGLEDFYKRFGL